MQITIQRPAITRRHLVETLENLLSDEFDSSELVYETEEQLIYRIIECALYYKENANQLSK